MSLPYKRSFTVGRGSEQLYNDELHKNFESTKHLLDKPEGTTEPVTPLDGALWLDRKTENKDYLKTWHQSERKWVNIFADKFQLTEHILERTMPKDPIKGQLWIYNETLCYYDGTQWKPVHALSDSSTQFDMSVFQNYLLLSPLWKQGNTILVDKDIEDYKETRRKYLQEKMDFMADSEYEALDGKYTFDSTIPPNEPPDFLDYELEGNCQLMVPSISCDRVFINDKLNHDYEEESEVVIRYPKDYLKDKTPSAIHVNPGKVTAIKKRLFLIDRQNPRIAVPPHNTEYYGFQWGDRLGHLLLPEAKADDGGYVVDDNGIILSYNDCQNYDFVVAITFTFGSVNPTGTQKHVDSLDNVSSYYVPDFAGMNNVFVNGLFLEDPSYKEYNQSQVITINEDTTGMDVQTLRSGLREYGFVREMSVDNKKAVFHVLHEYKQPLVFMGGEAMNPTMGEVSYNRAKNTFEVVGGAINMPWGVIELTDYDHPFTMLDPDDQTKQVYLTAKGEPADYETVRLLHGTIQKGPYLIKKDAKGHFLKNADGSYQFDESNVVDLSYYNMFESAGTVSETDSKGNGIIRYTNTDIGMRTIKDANGEITGKLPNIVLFVDGLMMQQSEIVLDETNHTISVPNMKKGQDYILLKDKYGSFSGDTELLSAFDVGRFSESLIYMNGCLLMNRSSIATSALPRQMTGICQDHEIMRFIGPDTPADQEYMQYDAENENWKTFTSDELTKLRTMLGAYDNTPRTVRFNFKWDSKKDRFDVYAFTYATDIEHAFIIRNLPATYTDPDTPFDENDKMLAEVMSGDAPELAPNRIHYFEADITDAITKLPKKFMDSLSKAEGDSKENQRKIRAEAIKSLSALPKYSSVYYHVFEKMSDEYIPNIGSLAVYVNGVRQDEVKELSTASFAIPWPVRGIVTYTIELPENGESVVAEREILDSSNIVSSAINVYRTNIALLPGRPVVYISGVRQPQDAYAVLDSHTLMFKSSQQLIGNKFNYPTETLLNSYDVPVTLNHSQEDRILVEVFKNTTWQEEHTSFQQTPNNFLVNMDEANLPEAMLRSADELRIYIDGLFFGLKNRDGYRKDTVKEQLVINRTETIDRLVSDPLYDFLMKNPESVAQYKAIRNERRIRDAIASNYKMTREEAIEELKKQGTYNEERLPDKKDLIIDWR